MGLVLLIVTGFLGSLGYEFIKNCLEPDFNKFMPPNDSNRHANLYVIDSNIWMDQSFGKFFDFLESYLREKNIKLHMSGIQYDEISNIKSKNREINSSLAKQRIQSFIQSGLLDIYDVGINSRRNAYFDEFLINTFVNDHRVRYIALLTSDRDLKIRMLALKNKSKAVLILLNQEEIIEKNRRK